MKRDLPVTFLFLILAFGCIYFISSNVERNWVTLPEAYEDEDLAFQAKKLKGYALGAEGLLSDWYWMRSLQYLGGKFVKQGDSNISLDDLRGLNPRLLYPMLDIATDLDPRSMAPFSFGATILPAINTDQAIELTQKGIAHNPENWRLHQYLGYIYWKTKNYSKAIEVYDAGANIPGAPVFFRLMAAKMRSDGGSRDTAREMYKRAMEEAPDGQSKTAAQLRLYQLDAFDELDVVNRVFEDHRVKTGRCANSWAEVLSALQTASNATGIDIRVDPSRNVIDPTGVPYKIDHEKCRAEINWPTSKIPPQ